MKARKPQSQLSKLITRHLGKFIQLEKMPLKKVIALEDETAKLFKLHIERAFEAGQAYEESKHYEDEDSEGRLNEYRCDASEPDFQKYFNDNYGILKPLKKINYANTHNA